MLDDYLDVLTVAEVAEILRIDRRTVMKLLKSGEIEYRKIGNVYRIRKDAVIDFLKEDEGRN